MLQYKLNFAAMDDNAVSQTEIFIPSAVLSTGQYSDLGMRYVTNVYNRQDAWIPFIDHTRNIFYTYKQFNNDVFEVDEAEMKLV